MCRSISKSGSSTQWSRPTLACSGRQVNTGYRSTMRSCRARVTAARSSGSSNHITPSITMRFSGLSMFSQRESLGDSATRADMVTSCPVQRAESYHGRPGAAIYSGGARASSSSISAP